MNGPTRENNISGYLVQWLIRMIVRLEINFNRLHDADHDDDTG